MSEITKDNRKSYDDNGGFNDHCTEDESLTCPHCADLSGHQESFELIEGKDLSNLKKIDSSKTKAAPAPPPIKLSNESFDVEEEKKVKYLPYDNKMETLCRSCKNLVVIDYEHKTWDNKTESKRHEKCIYNFSLWIGRDNCPWAAVEYNVSTEDKAEVMIKFCSFFNQKITEEQILQIREPIKEPDDGGHSDSDRTFTSSERATSVRFDCKDEQE